MNRRKILIAILFSVLAMLPFFFNYSNYAKTESMEDLIDSLESRTPDLLERYDIPGASISLIENGQIKWTGAFGYADIEAKKETDEDTVYQVASISKPVTAIGIMRLVERGEINLDDPIEKYLTRWQIPATTYNKNDITIRKLLSHTAGLSVGGGYPGYERLIQLPSLEESLSGIGGGSKAVELIREPGTQYSYSGGGYSMLQLLIEEVTGMDFTSFMTKEVLAPIKMDNSSFQWEEFLIHNTAKAYDEKLELLPNYLFIEKAAAGLYATLEDMSKFVIEEINSYKGSGLLNNETMLKMYEPVIEVKGLEGFIYQNTALGHFVNIDSNNNVLVAHDGSNNGWRANFSIAPDKGHGIVILTNGNNGTYLINEALNSWNYTVFGQDSSFDKLAHNVQSAAYSISLILLLWSVLILVSLVAGLRNGTRELKAQSNKIVFIKSCFLAVLILVVYLSKTILVPMLSFINPSIGNVLILGIIIRVILVVPVMFVLEKNINEQ